LFRGFLLRSDAFKSGCEPARIGAVFALYFIVAADGRSVISMIEATLPDSLALFALSIAASAAFLSRMRPREPVKDDVHNSGD
jgi:hypothetical protein